MEAVIFLIVFIGFLFALAALAGWLIAKPFAMLAAHVSAQRTLRAKARDELEDMLRHWLAEREAARQRSQR